MGRNRLMRATTRSATSRLALKSMGCVSSMCGGYEPRSLWHGRLHGRGLGPRRCVQYPAGPPARTAGKTVAISRTVRKPCTISIGWELRAKRGEWRAAAAALPFGGLSNASCGLGDWLTGTSQNHPAFQERKPSALFEAVAKTVERRSCSQQRNTDPRRKHA
jgi:hypothetical protein